MKWELSMLTCAVGDLRHQIGMSMAGLLILIRVVEHLEDGVAPDPERMAA